MAGGRPRHALDHSFHFRRGLRNVPVHKIWFTKFSDDLWGNTVNTARRMESTSQHGRAPVSPSTYAALKDSFVMEAASTVDCKDIGEVVTHFLVARV